MNLLTVSLMSATVFSVLTLNAGPPPRTVRHPISPVRLQSHEQSMEGMTRLYNSDVNRIVCAATDSRTQRTWLGYTDGMKLLDQKAGSVRHYGTGDGLPEGQVMTVAVDSQGAAWCIVRGEPRTLTTDGARLYPASVRKRHAEMAARPLRMHLCSFQLASGRWKILRTVLPTGSRNDLYFDAAAPSAYGPNRLFVGHAVRPQIDVGTDTVTFSLGVATPAAKDAVYQWNRRAKRLETVRWDANIRAANPALVVTFLATDKTNGGLWIGTNAGLLYRPKTPVSSTPAATTPWNRLLADQVIGEGTAATSGSGVWVTTTSRAGDDGFYRGLSPENPWKLFRVFGTAAKQTHDMTPPLPDEAGAAAPWKKGFLGPTLPNRSFPVAVTIDAAGALWLTQKGTEESGFGWTGYSPVVTLDAWWRHDPRDGWTHLERHRPWRPDSAMLSAPLLRETTATGVNSDNVSLNVLPDAAIQPLALYGFGKQEIAMVMRDGKPSEPIRRVTENPRPIFWMRQRFPAWICTENWNAKPVVTTASRLSPARSPL